MIITKSTNKVKRKKKVKRWGRGDRYFTYAVRISLGRMGGGEGGEHASIAHQTLALLLDD